MTTSVDIAIVGGGPCGLAAATIVASAGLRVAVFERKRMGGPRVGETFAPTIIRSLEALGIVDEFMALEKIPFRGVRSAWGSNDPIERPSIVHPLGDGFHVDRASFDALLARRAVDVGAVLHEDVGVCNIEAVNDGWALEWSNGHRVTARWVMDASGRGAPGGAKGLGNRHWVACDRAVAVVARLTPISGRELEPELLIEAAEDGWWYTVPQPGPQLLCVLMTDSDLLGPNARDDLASWWRAAMRRTVHTQALCTDCPLSVPPRVVRADTGFLWPSRGPGWCAVGDAAFGGDPLSGDGMLRGLASTIEVARRIVSNSDEQSQAPEKSIQTYLDRRQEYYRIEQRWPDALFWRRRHGIDWRTVPISLDPRSTLRCEGAEPTVESLAPIESLLPPRILRALLERLRQPCAAHEALGMLCSQAPLGTHRMLVGLQELIARGIVTSEPPH